MTQTKITFFSMFTGIGGFELGIQRAFSGHQGTEEKTERQGVQGGHPLIHGGHAGDPRCVGYSEIDKYAIQTFETNFGKEIKNYGDATKLNTSELPDFDFLVGGFPCQAFSVAGKRLGFDDTRGTLFFDVARVLRDKRPRYFILENVKGLLNHDGGKTFQTILEVLTDTGYDVSWSIHNSKNYGVPQNRERIYIVGNLREEPRPQVFPLLAVPKQTGEVRDSDNDTRRDSWNSEGEVRRTAERRAIPIREATKRGYALASDGDSVNLSQPNSQTRRGRVGKGIANTLDTGVQQGVVQLAKTIRVGGQGSPHGSKQNWDSYEIEGCIRRLTPLECERLQGFPDNWTVGSETQRYKQCGNAITVNVAEHVVRSIYG